MKAQLLQIAEDVNSILKTQDTHPNVDDNFFEAFEFPLDGVKILEEDLSYYLSDEGNYQKAVRHIL